MPEIHRLKFLNQNHEEFELVFTEIISLDGKPVTFNEPVTPTDTANIEARLKLLETFLMTFYNEYQEFLGRLEVVPEQTTPTPEEKQE